MGEKKTASNRWIFFHTMKLLIFLVQISSILSRRHAKHRTPATTDEQYQTLMTIKNGHEQLAEAAKEAFEKADHTNGVKLLLSSVLAGSLRSKYYWCLKRARDGPSVSNANQVHQIAPSCDNMRNITAWVELSLGQKTREELNCSSDDCDVHPTITDLWSYGCWCHFGNRLTQGQG